MTNLNSVLPPNSFNITGVWSGTEKYEFPFDTNAFDLAICSSMSPRIIIHLNQVAHAKKENLPKQMISN